MGAGLTMAEECGRFDRDPASRSCHRPGWRPVSWRFNLETLWSELPNASLRGSGQAHPEAAEVQIVRGPLGVSVVLDPAAVPEWAALLGIE